MIQPVNLPLLQQPHSLMDSCERSTCDESTDGRRSDPEDLACPSSSNNLFHCKLRPRFDMRTWFNVRTSERRRKSHPSHRAGRRADSPQRWTWAAQQDQSGPSAHRSALDRLDCHNHYYLKPRRFRHVARSEHSPNVRAELASLAPDYPLANAAPRGRFRLLSPARSPEREYDSGRRRVGWEGTSGPLRGLVSRERSSLRQAPPRPRNPAVMRLCKTGSDREARDSANCATVGRVGRRWLSFEKRKRLNLSEHRTAPLPSLAAPQTQVRWGLPAWRLPAGRLLRRSCRVGPARSRGAESPRVRSGPLGFSRTKRKQNTALRWKRLRSVFCFLEPWFSCRSTRLEFKRREPKTTQGTCRARHRFRFPGLPFAAFCRSRRSRKRERTSLLRPRRWTAASGERKQGAPRPAIAIRLRRAVPLVSTITSLAASSVLLRAPASRRFPGLQARRRPGRAGRGHSRRKIGVIRENFCVDFVA